MIRAVLFDLDGTLFDRPTSVRRCIEAQYNGFPQILGEVPEERYVSRFLELEEHGYVPKEVVYLQLANELSLPSGSSDVLYTDFYARYHRYAIGFPELHSTLQRLSAQSLSLAIITNGGEAHQRATIRALGIEPYFDVILISEAVGIRKPDPRIFALACERLRVELSEAVFVGDHPSVDIQGARSSGMRSVWRRARHWGECAGADAVIEDLSALPSVLALWA